TGKLQAPKVLVGAPHYRTLCRSGSEVLDSYGCRLIENKTSTPWTYSDLITMVPEAEAAICGVEEYTEEIIDQAPRLRVIARLGVGLDNIDLAAARRRSID